MCFSFLRTLCFPSRALGLSTLGLQKVPVLHLLAMAHKHFTSGTQPLQNFCQFYLALQSHLKFSSTSCRATSIQTKHSQRTRPPQTHDHGFGQSPWAEPKKPECDEGEMEFFTLKSVLIPGMPGAMLTILYLPFSLRVPVAITGGDALCIQHFQPLKLLPALC